MNAGEGRAPTGEEDTPPTEEVNPGSIGIDRRGSREIVEIIHREDRRAFEAVGLALDGVARLVDRVVEAFGRGGRLIYVGAGTSGRLGVLDSSECPPTFGVPVELVVGIIAGGEAALRRSIEGAEDSADDGARAIGAAGAGERDVVCGIAMSGRTPFVLGALREARRRGAATALVACAGSGPAPAGSVPADLLIELSVGPEVIAGSTRMKGGTATKMVLNMVSTAAMIRWGKVYDNLMVDLRPVNRKLYRRALGLIERVGGVGSERAADLFRLSEGEVKTAIVMGRRGVGAGEARGLLGESGGLLRPVIDRAPEGAPERKSKSGK